MTAKLDQLANLLLGSQPSPVVDLTVPEAARAHTEEQSSQRQALQRKISDAQATLATLSEDDPENPEMLSVLTRRIEQHKTAIIKLKPLGLQVESCREALNRALTRQASAVQGVAVARAAEEQANAAVAQSKEQLAALELAFASAHAPQHPAQESNADGLKKAVSRVMHDLSTSQHVRPEMVQSANSRVRALMDLLNQISLAATEASLASSVQTSVRKAEANDAAEIPVDKRHCVRPQEVDI